MLIFLICVPSLQAKEKDIVFSWYASNWPELEVCREDVAKGDYVSARACTGALVHEGKAMAGAYNLEAQIFRFEGKLEEAEEVIEKAIQMDPDHHLHRYQKALVLQARLKKAKNPMAQWKISSKVYKEYEKAMELKPEIYAYRRYIVVHKIQAPAMGGGDKEGAVALAEEGFSLGVEKCLLLRGYAYLSTKQFDKGYADLDEAMAKDMFGYLYFKKGGDVAAKQNQWERAEKYYRHLVKHIPSHPISHYILGKYFLDRKDYTRAAESLENAVQLNPDYMDASKKLAAAKKGLQ
jgi:tetratricopeptide (TPR) repeat protein